MHATSFRPLPHLALLMLQLAAASCAPGVPGAKPAAVPADAGDRKPTPPAADAPADRAAPPADRPLGEPRPEAAAVRVDGAADGDPSGSDGDGGGPDAGDDGVADAPPPTDAPPPARPPRPGEIAIVEVLVDPAGNDLGREWIEIISLAGEPVDLGALHVADSVLDLAVDGGLLLPGALLVLGQSADTAHNGGAPVARAYGTRLQLNNDADRISLCIGPCAGGVVLASFAWDGTLGAPYASRAVTIDPATAATCPASAPFGTEGSAGSPGIPNPPCPAVDAGPADGAQAQ